MPSTLNDSNFDSSIGSGVSVVKFSATWCGPCQRYAPTFDSVAGSRNDVSFYVVDIDESPNTSAKYGATSVPFNAVFVNGKKVDSIVGSMTADALNRTIDKAAGKVSGPGVLPRVDPAPSYIPDNPPLVSTKNLPLITSQSYAAPSKMTTYIAPPSNPKPSGSISNDIQSVVGAITSIFAPIAAAKQAKAAAREQQQPAERRTPTRSAAGSNMKYIVIGGGVLMATVLLYAAARD